MKKGKEIKYVLVGITMISMAIFNVYKVSQANQVFDHSTFTLSIIGESSSGEAGLFTCETSTTDSYDEYCSCQVCGQYHKRVTVGTYECNRGTLPVGTCRNGYVNYYYDCQNKETNKKDMTDVYLCTLY